MPGRQPPAGGCVIPVGSATTPVRNDNCYPAPCDDGEKNVLGLTERLAGRLFAGADLEVSTDWRTVLGELLFRRLGNTDLATVFPDYTMPAFIGAFRDGGGDGDLLFSDGCERAGDRR